jgi:hypothetical protein
MRATTYLGVGNSGSKILWDTFEFLFANGAQPDPNTRFLIGDADTNNSVLHKVHQCKLDKAVPPRAIDVMGLARYWSGGCGVYHIIGELLALTAAQDPEFRAQLDQLGAGEVVLLLSAGGGTGGGVGGYLLEFLPTIAHAGSIRQFAVLPEVSQFRRGGMEVHGPDGFQCASAGRFLLKFLGLTATARSNPDAPAASSPADLFPVSNSYLSCIPDRIGYQEGVKRVNRFIAHAVQLMPNVSDYPPSRHVTPVGVGVAPRTQPGDMTPQPAPQLAVELTRSALGPLDLARTCPVGLSALPTDHDTYSSGIRGLLGDGPALDQTALRVRALFRQCLGVDAQLWFNPDTTSAADALPVRHHVQARLTELFGPNVRVTVRDGGPLTPAYMPETDQPGVRADYALLVLPDDLIIDDVFRLAMYFIESSFAWQGGGVPDIAHLIQDVLADPHATTATIEETLRGGRAPDGNRVHLPAGARERYPARFWGNCEDLRSKVLQSLDRSEADFEARLLGPAHVAAGLAYFHDQLWRYR